MRKLIFLVFLISALIMSQTAVYADMSAASNKVYVPLPYILSTYSGLPQASLAGPSNQSIAGNQVDLSAIAADRGTFSCVLYKLMNPNDTLPPAATAEQKVKYGYEKYNDKRFESNMKDYTIWAMEAGYLSQNGKANHLLRVNWADIQSLLTALQIKPAIIEDYSVYDSDNWGFVTDSEKEMIGMFHAAFGRGIDTISIERQEFTLTIADLIYLAGVAADVDLIDIGSELYALRKAAPSARPDFLPVSDDEMLELTGYSFFTTDGRLDNGLILSVCFPYVRNDNNKITLLNLKDWAKKEGFINYEG